MTVNEQANGPYFSKFLFKTGLECPTRLYYHANKYRQNKNSYPFIEHSIYNKRLMKGLLRSIYPEGKFIEGNSIAEAADLTNNQLKTGKRPIFNGVFTYQQMVARIPVVVQSDVQITLFHVQTKAFDSQSDSLTHSSGRIISKWRRYLLEFAYQYYIAQKNLPGLNIRTVLVLPEKSGNAYTDNLPLQLSPYKEKSTSLCSANQELLVKEDVTYILNKIINEDDFISEHLPKKSFGDTLFYLRDLYLSKEKSQPTPAAKCSECEFKLDSSDTVACAKDGFTECWSKVMDKEAIYEFNILDLRGTSVDWMQQGIYDQRNIPDKELFDPASMLKKDNGFSPKVRQVLQILKAKGQSLRGEIILPELKKELQRWQYPLHFLDFEAATFALPVKKNCPPYNLIIFQFSCHTLHRGGSWKHHQWLDDFSDGYVNYRFVKNLMNIPRLNEGTVVQYSNFERSALAFIRGELNDEQQCVPHAEEMKSWIKNMIDRGDSNRPKGSYMADLCRIIMDYYYNENMIDSMSIKDVLGATMGVSDVLREKYSQPYSSQNFNDIIWWQQGDNKENKPPYSLLKNDELPNVNEGVKAMVTYADLLSQRFTNRAEIKHRKALLRYCELDTLAMMMLFQHLENVM